MTTIFRIQDAEGRGPWRPGFSMRWSEPRDDMDNLHPWFVEFSHRAIMESARGFIGCGCRTLPQMQRWFTPREYAKLIALGFTCVRMQVDRVLAESEIQLVFDRMLPLHRDVKRTALYPNRETA